MRVEVSLVFMVSLILPGFTSSAADILSEYPRSHYIVGVGEVQASGNNLKDQRTAEVLARVEIAKQLRVRVREESVDIMCEGKTSLLFKSASECQTLLSSAIEVTVDEVLEGSRIVEARMGETRGTFYAVAVLPRKDAASKAEHNLRESIERTKELLNQAKVSTSPETKKGHIERAKEELIKGMAYDGGRSVLEDTQARAKELLEQLAEEIKQLSSKP